MHEIGLFHEHRERLHCINRINGCASFINNYMRTQIS